jgi:hypothetical protein
MDDDASSTTAFFYGTLMSAAVLRRVIFGQKLPNSTTNRHLPAPRPALLQDYQRHRVSGADYPAVIPQNGSCVRGTVVTGLTEGDWWRLDLFEGEDYRRDVVKVLVKKQLSTDQGSKDQTWESLNEEDLESQGEEILVQTYIWKSSDTLLEPLEWDFDEFIREKLWRWAGEEADNEGEYEGRS